MPYQMKALICAPAALPGLSEKLIVSHYENNYGGAVKRLNAIADQLAGIDPLSVCTTSTVTCERSLKRWSRPW